MVLHSDNLAQGFHQFCDLANNLSHAYDELQVRVCELTDKLESVNKQRLIELNKKESLAKRLHGLLTMLPTAVIVLDGAGIVQECNPEAVNLLGRPLLGLAWCHLIDELFAPRLDDGHEVSMYDGRLVSIATRSLCEEPGQIIVINDLTKTRALQEQLSKDKHLKAMGKMIASLAHQIRTPLSTALLYAMQLESNKNLDEAHEKKFSNKIVSRLKYIEQQIKDMLIVARGGHIQLTTVDVDNLLASTQQMLQERLQEHKAQLMILNQVGACKIQAHFDTLQGALANLINNALDAQSNNATIHVVVAACKNNLLELHVLDNGPGMTKEVLDHVMEPFFTTHAQGTGLGLDVVRQVVEAHHGRLEITSQVSIGTMIKIFLPCYHVEAKKSECL